MTTHIWLLLRGLERTKPVLENTILTCTAQHFTLAFFFYLYYFKGALETFNGFRTVKPFRSLALPLQSSVTILSSCSVAAASSTAGHICWRFFSLDEHLSATSLGHRTLWILIHLLFDWTARHAIHDVITPFVTTAPRAEPTLVWSDLPLCSAARNKRPRSRKNKTL